MDMPCRIHFVFLLCLVHHIVADIPSSYNLTVMLPYTGGWAVGSQLQPAFRMAASKINADNTILPSTAINLSFIDSGCSGVGFKPAARSILVNKTNGMIGGGCSSACAPVSWLTEVHELPFLSCCCVSPGLSDKDVYPNFVRLVAPDSQEATFYVEMCSRYGWKSVGALSDLSSLKVLVLKSFKEQAEAAGISVEFESMPINTIKQGDDEFDGTYWIKKLRNRGMRIIFVIYAPSDIPKLLSQADNVGMKAPDYVFILTGGAVAARSWELQTNQALFHGSFGLLPEAPANQSLSQAFRQDMAEQYPNITFNSYAPLAYDSLIGIATALHTVIYALGIDPILNSASVMDYMRNSSFTFTGVSGQVLFDSNGDRIMEYSIQNMLLQTDNTIMQQTIGRFSVVTGIVNNDLNIPWIFPDNTSNPILDHFSCPNDCTSILQGNCSVLGVCECAEFFSGLDCSIDLTPVLLEVSTGLRFVFLGLSCISIILIICLSVFLISKREEPVVACASFSFLLLTLMGVFCALLVPIIYGVHPLTDYTCRASVILFHLSFSVVYSSLFAKTLRMRKIFTIQIRKITDSHLVRYVGCVLFFQAIVLLCWLTLSPLKSVLVYDRSYYYQSCQSDQPMYSIMPIIIDGIVLVWGAFESWSSRNVPSKFSEKKHVGLCIYNTCLLAAVFLPVIHLMPTTPNILYTFTSTGIIIGSYSVIGFIYLPKVYKLRRNAKACPGIPEAADATGIAATAIEASKTRWYDESYSQDDNGFMS